MGDAAGSNAPDKVSQTDPHSLLEIIQEYLSWRRVDDDVKDWSLDIVPTVNTVLTFVEVNVLPLPISHLFLWAVQDHQVCSSVSTVLSAVSPVFPLSGDIVTAAVQLLPAIRTAIDVCLKNTSYRTSLVPYLDETPAAAKPPPSIFRDVVVFHTLSMFHYTITTFY